MQTLKVEQTLLQAGLLHSHLEMGHLLHIQAQWNVFTGYLMFVIHRFSLTSGIRSPDITTLQYLYVCGEIISATPTLMLSGRPSSRLLSFSLLVIMLTVSSTFGLVLLLLLSCCSSVPVSAASLWSVLVLHITADGLEPPCPLSPQSPDCVNFSSKRGQQFRKIWWYGNRECVNLRQDGFWFSGRHIGIVAIIQWWKVIKYIFQELVLECFHVMLFHTSIQLLVFESCTAFAWLRFCIKTIW